MSLLARRRPPKVLKVYDMRSRSQGDGAKIKLSLRVSRDDSRAAVQKMEAKQRALVCREFSVELILEH